MRTGRGDSPRVYEMAKVRYFNARHQEIATITVVTRRLTHARKIATRHAKDKLMLIPDGNWKHSHAGKHTRSMIRRHTGSKYTVVVDMNEGDGAGGSPERQAVRKFSSSLTNVSRGERRARLRFRNEDRELRLIDRHLAIRKNSRGGDGQSSTTRNVYIFGGVS